MEPFIVRRGREEEEGRHAPDHQGLNAVGVPGSLDESTSSTTRSRRRKPEENGGQQLPKRLDDWAELTEAELEAKEEAEIKEEELGETDQIT